MKIKSIKHIGKSRVINLTVHKNHTFITKNGIVTHNCDTFTKDAQFAFRGLIESFASNCRFILTGNFKENMLEPLLDRLENYDFNVFNKQELAKPIFKMLSDILKNENIEFDQKDLVPIINTYFPSIRSMVGAIQKFSSTGKLIVNQGELDNQAEYNKVIDSIKNKDFSTMINLVNELNSPDNLFTYIYKNINLFPENKMPNIIMSIAKYQFQSSSVRDKNLNLAAACTELMQI